MIATHFEKFEALSAALKKSLQLRSKNEPTTLLIKGSRFMHMEKVVKDLVERNNEIFFKLLVLNSFIISFVSFIQPRFLVSGFSIIMFWLFYKKGIKLGVLFLLPSLAITLILPGSLILRNSNAVGLNVISTNLGTTMNIGAGSGATGGYLSKGDYGVPCQTSGSESEQDAQKVLCVLNWYVENPTKATKLFYNKSIFFWSPWFGPEANGTMARNPWLKVSPIKNITSTQDGVNLVYGGFGKIISWLWLLGGWRIRGLPPLKFKYTRALRPQNIVCSVEIKLRPSFVEMPHGHCRKISLTSGRLMKMHCTTRRGS
jgi:hypothetical protein